MLANTECSSCDIYYLCPVIPPGYSRYSITHSLTHSLTGLLTYSLTHSRIYSLTCFCSLVPQYVKDEINNSWNSLKYQTQHGIYPSHLPTHLLTYSLTHSLTHSLTYSLTHSLTYLLTHSPTYSLTHLLTHLFIPGCEYSFKLESILDELNSPSPSNGLLTTTNNIFSFARCTLSSVGLLNLPLTESSKRQACCILSPPGDSSRNASDVDYEVFVPFIKVLYRLE